MRTIAKLITAPALCILTFSNCTKKNTTTPVMHATVNGNAFEALGYEVVSTGGDTVSVSGSNLPIQGSPIPTAISIRVCSKPGTYQFDSTANSGHVTITFASPATKGEPIFAQSGQVKVTQKNNHVVQGTFSFTARDASGLYTVNNGSFIGTF